MATKNFEDDNNYQILRDAYTALEIKFDEVTAPAKVADLVFEAKDLLDDALSVYESGEADKMIGDRAQPRTGEIWRHFKGGKYEIVCTAVNATNGDCGKCVVYKSVEAPDKRYIRELGEFMSAVDRKKYPDATQKWRFEKTLSDYSCWPTGGVGALNGTGNSD